jgi:hypothetical protein
MATRQIDRMLHYISVTPGDRLVRQWSSTAPQPIRLVHSYFDICINLSDWLPLYCYVDALVSPASVLQTLCTIVYAEGVPDYVKSRYEEYVDYYSRRSKNDLTTKTFIHNYPSLSLVSTFKLE